MSDLGLPLVEDIFLGGHSKAVACVAIDPSGSRCLTGSHDSTIRFWDFAGMDKLCSSFRVIEPVPEVKILDIDWSIRGDCFLVATHTTQCRLFNRDGKLITDYAKGDMYLRDLRHTLGHTANLTCVRWHPTDPLTFATAGNDSTIRIWDIEDCYKQKSVIVFKKGSRGAEARTQVSKIRYSNNHKLIAGTGADGSLRMWKADGPYAVACLQNLKANEEEVCALEFCPFNDLLITRTKNSLRLWDKRKLSLFIHELKVPGDCAVWSPTGQYICYSCPEDHDPQVRGLCILDQNFNQIDIPNIVQDTEQVTSLLWHSHLNQIASGTIKGNTTVRFHETASYAGALLCKTAKISKSALQKAEVMDALRHRIASTSAYGEQGYGGDGAILAEYNAEKHKQLRKLQKQRIPQLFKKEKVPGGGVVLTGQLKNVRAEDPRAALLKYNESAVKDPYWVNPAYKNTQPTTLLADDVLDDDELDRVIEEEDRNRVKRMRF